MKNILLLILLLLFSDKTYSGYGSNNTTYLISIVGGFNASSFINTQNNIGTDFTIGIYFNNPISEKFVIIPMLTFSRLSSYLENISGRFYGIDYIYKTHYNLDFKASFIDIYLLCNYEIHETNNLTIHGGLGVGYSVGIKDYSEVQNLVTTDEIIEDYSQYSKPVDYYADPNKSFARKNNGFLLSTNLTFNYQRVNLTLMYSVRLFKVNYIDELHTVTLLIGFWF